MWERKSSSQETRGFEKLSSCTYPLRWMQHDASNSDCGISFPKREPKISIQKIKSIRTGEHLMQVLLKKSTF